MNCSHANQHLVWTTIDRQGDPLVGIKQLRHQCRDCGELSSKMAPHSQARPNTPMVDAALVALWNAKKAASWKTKRTTLLAEKEALRRGWLVKYNAYLQGDEWRAKRVLVLRRADWTCEGCGNARATQVHHTTYDHAGNEFLWELVAVCDECHERFHGREIGEPDFE